MSDASCSAVVGLGRVRLGVGLVAALTAALLMWSPAPAGAVAGYGDVPEETWYTNPVQWATDNGIANIVGSCFGPSSPVSRGETAVWLHNLEGQPAPAAAHSFVDVTDAAQHDAISWMAETGITTGTSPTTFAPDDTLTRAQAAAFLHRLADEPPAPAHSFGDVVAGWQQQAVSWMSRTGITTGTSPTTFAPDDTLTRAHLVTFLYRYSNNPTVTVDANSPRCATFKTVSAGDGHSCAIRADDTIICWGNNDRGQTDAPGGAFKAVSVSIAHSCGLRADDTITCWGNNYRGEADAPAGAFKAVSAGSGHSCGLRADDTITCWGWNQFGQADAPTGAFKTVSSGIDNSFHSCAIRADDTITCWGHNGSGQTDAPGGAFKAVSVGGSRSCAIRADDTITCWGLGQADVPTGAFKAVAVGASHSCAIRADDTITCWGWNGEGQTDAPTGAVPTPAGAFKAVSVSSGHSCAVRADDTITCWGNNGSGQTDAPTGAFKTVSPGGVHSCAVRADDTITCWGRNNAGQADAPT